MGIKVIKHDWLYYIGKDSTPEKINFVFDLEDAKEFHSVSDVSEFLESRFEAVGHDGARWNYKVINKESE